MANAIVIGVEHIDYEKNGVRHNYFNLHYGAEPKEDDENMQGRYAKVARTNFDCSEISAGMPVKLIFELDPKWNRSELVEIIPV
jgi:hypothetical protein